MNKPIIKQIPIGPLQVLTYLVACPQTREAVIIDPAGEEEKISTLIEEEDVVVKYILNTHGHADHVLANQRLKQILSVPTCMHELDDKFFSQQDAREESSKEFGLPLSEPVDIKLQDGNVLEVGTLEIRVIHTPGHTPGSVCFLVNGNLFTGDTLFVGAVGRTDLTGASLDTLLDSLERKLLPLPPETIVWPGHDYGETPTSTIGREMKENPYITDFILDK
ncbi:MAG: MBL fold metallo-hydrolase [Desulfobacteraceae bacterium]|jgi:glyoxylase-like metal-dependent hydrolase (beta-lactamase superfamily II)